MADKQKGRTSKDAPTATVVLGGGAPNSPLMAGALSAIYDHGKTFNVFYTSGAGALIGLVYLAPKGMTTPKALASLVQAGVADPIFDVFPLPFKTFYKLGPFSGPMRKWSQMFKISPDTADKMHIGGASMRLFNDSIDFWTAMITPTTLTPNSLGLCEPYPLLADEVDFDKLRKFSGEFFMNAYSISKGEMVEFNKNQVDIRHFHAAMSFPFMYPPQEIDGHYYFEGSSMDPLNLPKLKEKHVRKELSTQTVVLIDVLGSLKSSLVRKPRNLMDAFGISIMTPVVSLAEKNVQHFKDVHHSDPTARQFELLELKFDIPEADRPYVTDWSYSNLSRMLEIGLETGERFVKAYGDLLPDREQDSPNPVMASRASALN
jgi:NTE family protein